MVITYYGASFFKCQFGSTTLAFNPISKESKLKGSKFGADLCFISTHHPDMNGATQVSIGDSDPFVVSGPCEIEAEGVFAKGFQTKTNYGGGKNDESEEGSSMNTVYSVLFEDMNLVFLGALKDPELDPKTLEGLGEPDILFVPVGGEGTLSPSEAYKLALKFEAHVIIPMLFDGETLAAFAEASGESKEKPVEKLTIKKKEVLEREGDIVLLSDGA